MTDVVALAAELLSIHSPARSEEPIVDCDDRTDTVTALERWLR